MPDELISKRLHISGLTTAISSHDLERRLATFGSLTALDGFGKLDALGQPRKFAYVTLQTTKSQLSRCMNVLSGSTWKGAKLRIGEAKSDYHERIVLEKAAAESDETARPRKRRRLAVRGVQARHARDMSLVTSSNVHQSPQWCVTPLGRLIRPMRMRPARPIGLPLDVLKAQNQNPSFKSQGGKEGRKRRRTVASTPPTRARRLTIDPLRWGSTHISGVFLEGERALMSPALDAGGETSAKTGVSSEVEGDDEVEKILDASQSPADDNDEPSTPPGSSSIPVDTTNADLAAEKATALRLLYSMFGEADEDWGGAENVDSDMEREVAAANSALHASQSSSSHDAVDFEVVPAAQRASKKSSIDQRQTAQTTTANAAAPLNPDPVQPPTATKLKDLFAPREEEGFSLIGHLNLDSELELDLDLGFDESAFTNNGSWPASVPTSDPITTTRPAATPTPTRQIKTNSLDTTLPFFFPQTSKGGGYARNFKVKFARTEDETQIRARWEAARGELTREWKRRHREAVKSRRRRGGGGGERVE
ncbi:hypothetical protein F5888DRAFT_1808403 [Russula emetica]|nr:hypothetical protein F5888DRAFT_1808403 [Russula emetica]